MSELAKEKIGRVVKGVIKTPEDQIKEIHSMLADMDIIVSNAEEWQKTVGKFRMTALEGGFSNILEGFYMGKPALLKRLTTIKLIESEVLNYALAQLGCPEKFCSLLKVYISESEPITAELLMDNCGFSLEEKLKLKEHRTMKECVRYVIQICDSLKCLHDLDIKHLDIKPSNIVIDDKNNAKIIDFGLSMFDYFQDPKKPRVSCKRGSPKYAAFEIVAHSLCTKQSDIFSLGLTIMVALGLYDINDYISQVTSLPRLYTEYNADIQDIIDKNIPFSILNVFVNVNDITQEEYQLMKQNPCYNMINSMLDVNRTLRPTIDAVLSFFMDYYSKL
jgi:serine/threonine protein kinase